jgi:cell division septation protein DedD
MLRYHIANNITDAVADNINTDNKPNSSPKHKPVNQPHRPANHIAYTVAL